MIKNVMKMSVLALSVLLLAAGCTKKTDTTKDTTAPTNSSSTVQKTTATTDDLAAKVAQLEQELAAKEDELANLKAEKTPVYDLDEALSKKIYTLYKGVSLTPETESQLQVTYVGLNHSAIYSNEAGAMNIYVIGKYAVVTVLNGSSQLDGFKVFDLSTETEVTFPAE